MSAERMPLNETLRFGENMDPVFGPIRLIPGLRSVTTEGRSVQLSPIEYQVLWMLTRAQGGPLNDAQMREFIYDDPSIDAPLGNVVLEKIASIRKKLESIDSKVIIINERGFGYKLALKQS